MEWWVALLIMFGVLFALFATGLPIVFSFLVMNLLGMCIFIGTSGSFLQQLILSLQTSVMSFSILPLPLFVLMGEVLWHSGAGSQAIEVLDKMLGRLPGRLSIITVIAGVIFAAVSGSNMANTALLGSVMAEPMAKRGYKKPMILGPIMGSGALAMMIPPSALGVICAAIAGISVGKLLIGIILPGVILASFYLVYIIIRCILQPDLAPYYEITKTSLSEKILAFIKYLLPLGVIIFLTVALLFFGIATPSESAALGCLASCTLGVIHGRFKWVKKSLIGTLRVTVMALIIIASATTFSQLLAYSGGSRGFLEAVTSWGLSPMLIIICMQIILIILGGPMEEVSLMMVSLPIYMPIVQSLGFDPVWFGVLILLNVEIAIISPPFGIVLFVMKGVAPKDTTMGDIYRSTIPFLVMQLFTMALVIAFPKIALWLPNMMSAVK
jgi:tripartite ATP-independent transporter DctM subunit